jgi:hypothetical protein
MKNPMFINANSYWRLGLTVSAVCLLGFTGCSSFDARAGQEAHQTQVARQLARQSVHFHTPAAKAEDHTRSLEQVIKDQRDWYQMRS